MNERSKRSGNKLVEAGCRDGEGGWGEGHFGGVFFYTVLTTNSLVCHITGQIRPWYYTVRLVYCVITAQYERSQDKTRQKPVPEVGSPSRRSRNSAAAHGCVNRDNRPS